MTYNAIRQVQSRVDMGRNIQAEDPKAMAKAVAKVVHENYTGKEAYDYYLLKIKDLRIKYGICTYRCSYYRNKRE